MLLQEVESFQGYYAPAWKSLLFYALCFCTGGFAWICCKWSPRIYILLGLSQCALSKAEHVLVRVRTGSLHLPPPAQVDPSCRCMQLLDGQEGLTAVQLIRTYDACNNAPGLSPSFEHEATSESLLDWQVGGWAFRGRAPLPA